MKKVIISLFLLFVLIIGNAQPINPTVYNETNFMEGIYDINANFYEVKAAGEAYFAQDSALRIGNSHGYKDFLRFIQFWGPRSFDDGIVSGDLNRYHELIRGYSQNRATTCTNVPGISDGFNWNFLGPKNLPDQYLGMVTSVAYYNDNGANIIFAGSAAGGVFKTEYSGTPNPIWTCITDDLNFPGIGFTDLRVLDDGANRRYLFAGTGMLHRNYGIGILRYDLENPQNGWENVTDPSILNPAGVIEESHVHHIVIHPLDKSIVYATMGSKIYKSDSYGDLGSWEEIFYTGDVVTHPYPHGIKLSKIIFHPADPNIMYVSSYTTLDPTQAPPVIFKTTDGGDSWTIFPPSQTLPSTARIDISTANYLLNASNPNLDPIYCALSIGTTTNIFYFDDFLSSFTGYPDVANGGSYFTRHCFELSPDKYNLATGQPNMYFGTLGFHYGENGILNPNYTNNLNMHVDIRDMEIITDFSLNGNNHILIGNDGGISLSVDNGLNWVNLNGSGLNITQFQGIDVAEANTDVIVGGTQDNEAYVYSRSNDTWTRFGSGDVYNFQISEKNGDDIFYSNNAGSPILNQSKLSNLSATPGIIAGINGGSTTVPQYQHSSGFILLGKEKPALLEDKCTDATIRFLTDFNSYTCINGDIQSIAACEERPSIGYLGFNGIKNQNDPCIPTKLFKSTNLTTLSEWEDITLDLLNAFPGIFDYVEISNIVVNSEHPDTIWISFGKISSDGNRRVVRSIDGGDNWIDYSNNLPGIPINDLEFYKGSSNGVFAATDIGMFYTDDNIYATQGWVCISNNLPVLLINDIEINYTLNKIVLGTFGRGIYEADLPAQLTYSTNSINPFDCDETDFIVNSTMVINEYNSCGNIIVKPGAKLTITGSIFMQEGKEIIVENSTVANLPGGRLILDGGHITIGDPCNGDEFWGGVFVMGDPAVSQYPLSTTKQGYFEIINGGKISNANVAVSLGRFSSFTISGQGGVVRTNDAEFANNKKDVFFWPYQNFQSTFTNPVANLSRFFNTKFLQKNGIVVSPVNIPVGFEVSHVNMLGVDGILFLGCSFENNAGIRYETAYNLCEKRGNGIYSVNSSFRLTGFCNFYEDPLPNNCDFENTFNGLFYGIKAISSNPLKTVFIDGNNFERNYHAIFLNGVDYAYIARNKFNVGNVDGAISLASSPTNPDIPYGLHLNQCNNYKVTENYFDGTISFLNPLDPFPAIVFGPKVSLQISLPDGNPEEIYNNYFEDYHGFGNTDPGVGILVQGDINDTDPNITSGLQLLCNDFAGAYVNSAERYTNHIALTQNGKLDPDQGANIDAASPAGNTFINVSTKFHDNCTVNSVSYPDAELNTIDGLINGVDYYHHSNTTTFPLDVQCGSTNIGNNPTPFPYQKQIACPTIINPNPQPLLFRQAINAYNTSINKEFEFIDADDTQGLLNMIFGNASPGQVKNALMLASPYLSDEVLKAYLYDSPPHGHLKQVVIANSPVSKDVKQIIDGMSLPNGIRNQINAAQIGISERQHLDARVNWFELKKEQNINELVRYHLQRDTVPDYLDSVKQVLTQYNETHNACKLASAFASQKDYIQALSILDAHLSDHPDDALCKLQKLMIEFDQQLSWCLNPTQDQKDKLEDIKDDHHKGCVAAKGFLELIEGLPMKDYRILPKNSDNRSMFITQEEQILESEKKILLYPNPTQDWITIHSDLKDENFSIEILDISGRLVLELKTMNPTSSIDLTRYSNGIYTVKVSTIENGIQLFKLVKN